MGNYRGELFLVDPCSYTSYSHGHHHLADELDTERVCVVGTSPSEVDKECRFALSRDSELFEFSWRPGDGSLHGDWPQAFAAEINELLGLIIFCRIDSFVLDCS